MVFLPIIFSKGYTQTCRQEKEKKMIFDSQLNDKENFYSCKSFHNVKGRGGENLAF